VSWSAQVFRYCERGLDPAFWGEPLNAITNGAFILAALGAAVAYARQPKSRSAPEVMALIALVFVIGVGSFLFHTFATRWAAMADVIPIGIFMLAYMGYALRAYVKLGWILTAVGVALFIAVLQYAGAIQCRPGLISTTEAARGPCLNGTVGYAPAFFAMVGIGAVLLLKRHPAAPYLLSAGAIFFFSMLFRIIDPETCTLTTVNGRPIGTHFLWHVLNAVTLYLLLLAAVRHRRTWPERIA
jgi:hypothetical protein